METGSLGSHFGQAKLNLHFEPIRFDLSVSNANLSFSIASSPLQPACIKPSDSPPHPANASAKRICLLLRRDTRRLLPFLAALCLRQVGRTRLNRTLPSISFERLEGQDGRILYS